MALCPFPAPFYKKIIVHLQAHPILGRYIQELLLRSINGRITRAYAHADGQTFIVEGQPTPIEQPYQLVNTLSEEPGYQEREDLTYACEEEVMTVAGAWSINPSTLHERKDLPPGLGLLGFIP